MDERGFRRAASVLSREHGIRVLRHLSSGEWRIASEVSRALNVHTSTVSNLLAPMYELGFLQRRVRSSTTRTTFEYRLPSTRIVLDLDFKPTNVTEESAAYYTACIEHALARLERLGWPALVDRIVSHLGSSRDRIPADLSARFNDTKARGLKEYFSEVQRDLIALAAESIGRAAAVRLFDTAAKDARKGREELVDKLRLLPQSGGVP